MDESVKARTVGTPGAAGTSAAVMNVVWLEGMLVPSRLLAEYVNE
jgi:hypothetical protein